MTGHIFDIYRGTTHDGPGIRDSVFFQGCPLACRWCHNPEGISFSQQVWWEARDCIGCLSCVSACPQGAIVAGAGGIEVRRDRCVACLECVRGCPSTALRQVCREYSVEDLVREVTRDMDYYRQFGGGITASGGECLMQRDFLEAFFRELKALGIHTAVDTSGQVPWQAFEKVLDVTDHVLYDLKLWDPELHREYTGQDNRLILDNFLRLVQAVREGSWQGQIWVRTPLIPGATATAENIVAIAAFLAPCLGREVSRWEMCSFNNACTPKYRKLGQSWPYAERPLLSQEAGQALRAKALEAGCDGSRVILTGILTG